MVMINGIEIKRVPKLNVNKNTPAISVEAAIYALNLVATMPMLSNHSATDLISYYLVFRREPNGRHL